MTRDLWPLAATMFNHFHLQFACCRCSLQTCWVLTSPKKHQNPFGVVSPHIWGANTPPKNIKCDKNWGTYKPITTYWCLVENGWEWGNGITMNSYYGSFPHSLLSTSKTYEILNLCRMIPRILLKQLLQQHSRQGGAGPRCWAAEDLPSAGEFHGHGGTPK